MGEPGGNTDELVLHPSLRLLMCVYVVMYYFVVHPVPTCIHVGQVGGPPARNACAYIPTYLHGPIGIICRNNLQVSK